MKFRRIALTVATTAAVTAGAVSVPTADAYTVDYNAETEKCTISYTENDKSRINEAYKNLYTEMADQVFTDLEKKTETTGTRIEPYTQEERNADIKLVREYAAEVKDPAAKAEGGLFTEGSVAQAQRRLATYEGDSYWLYVGLMKASKTDKITDTTLTLTQEEAEDRAAVFGLDLKNVAGATVWALILQGGTDQIAETAQQVVQDDVLKVAAPVAAYNKSLKACTDGKSESSSVPAGSSMSMKGLGIAIGAAFAGLLLLTGFLGFSLRPIVDQYFAK